MSIGVVETDGQVSDSYKVDVSRGQRKQRMKEAGKSFEVHWYSVGHASANPEFSDYNKAAADAAWANTVEFLHRNLRWRPV